MNGDRIVILRTQSEVDREKARNGIERLRLRYGILQAITIVKDLLGKE